MNIRKRKTPTPAFGLPPPFNPTTGEHADLFVKGERTPCAMMQVAAADTFDDYLICRGYDPEARRFFDYVEGDSDKVGLLVAKPYGKRGTNPYVIGQVFAAMKPVTRLGETSGVAAVTMGHPADLDEVIDILYDDGGSLAIAWILLDSSDSNPLLLYEITSAGTYDAATTKEWSYVGKTVLYDTDTDLYTVQSGESEATLWHPTAIREDLTDDSPSDEAAETQRNFYVGQRVYVALRNSRYEIISPPLDEWRFELKNALSIGGTAQAYFRRWTGAAWVTDTTIEITVTDRKGVYLGRGVTTYSSPHDTGSMGTAKYWPDSNKWEITWLQPHALMIRGKATAIWTGTTFSIDGVAIMQPSGAIITQVDPGSNITISDWLNWDGLENDDVLAVWDQDSETFKAIQKTCAPL